MFLLAMSTDNCFKYFDEDYLDDEEELEPAPSSRRAQKMNKNVMGNLLKISCDCKTGSAGRDLNARTGESA